MNLIKPALALCFIVGVVAATPAYAGQVHASSAGSVPAAVPRWKPDAALREGMRQARDAVAELSRAESGQKSATMVRDRAGKVEATVSYMFAHCRLAPAPDAALHGILVPLLRAAQALKTHPDRIEAVSAMRSALADYPRYFDDPDPDPDAAAAAAAATLPGSDAH